MKKSSFVILVVVLVILLDQSLKIWVKTNMGYGFDINMLGLDWARLHFVENPGMAFGWQFGGEYGKLILSIFRIAAVGFLFYLITTLVKSNAKRGLLISFALILAGALGNIIDSTFYGLIFSESRFHGQLATMFPPEGGYAPLFYGKVVDMLYFPMFEGYFPEWIPRWGGKPFLFFKPVFNLADSAITCGVANLLLFHRDFFKHEESPKKGAAEEGQKETPVPKAETDKASSTMTDSSSSDTDLPKD